MGDNLLHMHTHSGLYIAASEGKISCFAPRAAKLRSKTPIFDPESDISTTTGESGMISMVDIHVPQRMNPKIYHDLLIFPLVVDRKS